MSVENVTLALLNLFYQKYRPNLTNIQTELKINEATGTYGSTREDHHLAIATSKKKLCPTEKITKKSPKKHALAFRSFFGLGFLWRALFFGWGRGVTKNSTKVQVTAEDNRTCRCKSVHGCMDVYVKHVISPGKKCSEREMYFCFGRKWWFTKMWQETNVTLGKATTNDFVNEKSSRY